MPGISNFLRSYEFLDLTRSVTEAQMAEYRKPNQTWAQTGNKWYNVCKYNIEAPFAVGLDVITCFAVSTLHRCCLFLPLPPAPPTFPIPHDNVEFLRYAIGRALWNWDPALKKEMEEGIADNLSDKWNVFQVVGEWSLAWSFENAPKSSYHKPTFLTISEPLENGESYRSVGTAFARLGQKEQTAILNALYRQEAPLSLSSSGKKVYQNIRSLASKLHQGNQIYLSAFGEYSRQKAAGAPPTEAPVAPHYVYQPRRANPPEPSAPPMPFEPSAPPLPIESFSPVERKMIEEVQFLNRALVNAIDACDPVRKRRIVQSVIDDGRRPFGNEFRPGSLIGLTPESSPGYFVARLSILHYFKESFQRPCRRMYTPGATVVHTGMGETLTNGKTLTGTGSGFAELSDRDFALLQAAIVNPARFSRLNGVLREKLRELSEFAELLHRNENFLKTYEAFRIDLVAS